MPLFVHSVVWSFAVHCKTIKLSGKTNCKVSHINHFLNFSKTFGIDFTHFKSDQFTKRVFVFSKFKTHSADNFTTLWSRHYTPFFKGFLGFNDDCLVIFFSCLDDCSNSFAIDWGIGDQFLALCFHPTIICAKSSTVVYVFYSEFFQEIVHFPPH